MGDTMQAQWLRPGHIVATPDHCEFVVEATDDTPGGIEIRWTDGMVETYDAESTFDVIGEASL